MLAQKRLVQEIRALNKNPPQFIRAMPLENNILEFHYVIQGPPDSLYAGGWYHGILKFPSDYPLKPPSVVMLTPSGRFDVNKKICLSMSDFHPETWNPMWSVSTILVGLLSFMLESTKTVGSVESTDHLKRMYAAQSLEYNCRDETFRKLFPDLVVLHEKSIQAGAGGPTATGLSPASPVPAPKPSTDTPLLSLKTLLIALVIVYVVYKQLMRGPDGL